MGGHLSYFSGKLGVTTSETIIDPSLGAADSSPLLALCDRPSVWPDVGVKSSPIFSKSCPKCSQCRFYIRVRFFKIAQRVAIILATFARDFVTKNFQKSPNLVTLSSTDWLMMHTNTLTYDSAGASRKTSKRQNVANVFATATSSIPLHSNSIKS